MDSRAQGSISVARFFLGLIVGAILFWILSKIATPILSGAKETTNAPQANQATTWFQQGVDFLPVWYLIIGLFGLLVLAVFQREVLR